MFTCSCQYGFNLFCFISKKWNKDGNTQVAGKWKQGKRLFKVWEMLKRMEQVQSIRCLIKMELIIFCKAIMMITHTSEWEIDLGEQMNKEIIKRKQKRCPQSQTQLSAHTHKLVSKLLKNLANRILVKFSYIKCFLICCNGLTLQFFKKPILFAFA